MADTETSAPASKPTATVDHVSIVEAWFASTFPNSVVSRDTEIWNFVHAAKADLVKRLIEEA